jgi:hypothetical protein
MKGPIAVAVIVVAAVLGRIVNLSEDYFRLMVDRSSGLESVEPSPLSSGIELVYEIDPPATVADPASLAWAARYARDVVDRRMYDFDAAHFRVFLRGSRLAVQVDPDPGESLEAIRSVIERRGAASVHIVSLPEDQTEARIREAVAVEEAYLTSLRRWWAGNRAPDDAAPLSPPRRIARPEAGPDGSVAPGLNQWGNSLTLLMCGEGGMAPIEAEEETEIFRDEKGRPVLEIRFVRELRDDLWRLTSANRGRFLAFLLDGKVVQIATILSALRDRAQLSGKYDEGELRLMGALLQGELPVGLRLVSQAPIRKAGGDRRGGGR